MILKCSEAILIWPYRSDCSPRSLLAFINSQSCTVRTSNWQNDAQHNEQIDKTSIPSQCQQHHNSLIMIVLLSPGSLQARPIKNLSHKSNKTPWSSAGPQEHADHLPTLIPPYRRSHGLRQPSGSQHPGRQTSPVSHSTPRGVLIGGRRGGGWERGCHRRMSVWFSACRPMCEMQAEASCEINKSIFLKRRGSVHMPVSQSTACISITQYTEMLFVLQLLYAAITAAWAKYAHSVASVCVLQHSIVHRWHSWRGICNLH